MTPAAEAIARLYRMNQPEFDDRFGIMAANIKARFLEDFRSTPGFVVSDLDDLLGMLSSAVIATQKAGGSAADISDEQKIDFETRIDHCLADAVIVVRDSFLEFGERESVEFQMETAGRLGIPVA